MVILEGLINTDLGGCYNLGNITTGYEFTIKDTIISWSTNFIIILFFQL